MAFTAYGLICAAGVLAGLAAAIPDTLRRGHGWDAWVRFAVLTALCGWVCARLAFIVPDLIMGVLSRHDIIMEHSSVFLDHIGSAVPALYFWEGGYALAGAIPGAILGAWIAEKRTGVRRGFFRDRLSLGLPLFIAAERLAEGEVLYRYEALLAAAVLAVMIVLHLRARDRNTDGDLLRIFLVIFCLPLAWIESFRPLTGHMVIHFVNVTQVAAAVTGLAPAVRWSVLLRRGRAKRGLKAGLLAGGWVFILAMVGLAVFCIFGMEKDWIGRGPAHALIAVSLSLIGAVSLVFRRFAAGKGNQTHGA